MRLHRRLVTTVVVCALAIGALVTANIATATPNQFLDKANGHSTLDNGKPIAHPSSGSEVTFDDERALGADTQSTAASDAPPDATASAVGCGRCAPVRPCARAEAPWPGSGSG